MGESLENGQDSPAPYIPDQDTAKATNICQSAGCVRGRERTIEASTCLVSVSESLSLPGSYNLKINSGERVGNSPGERQLGTALEREQG